MLIVPRLITGDTLALSAYSFDKSELDAVAQVVADCGGTGKYVELGPGRGNRPSRRYMLSGDVLVEFQQRLGIEFARVGRRTITKMGRGPLDYRCQEVTEGGMGTACEDMDANDDQSAMVKCALIANMRRWFGGVSSRGRCFSV